MTTLYVRVENAEDFPSRLEQEKRASNPYGQQIKFKRFSSLLQERENENALWETFFSSTSATSSSSLLDFQFYGKVLVTWRKTFSFDRFYCFSSVKIVSSRIVQERNERRDCGYFLKARLIAPHPPHHFNVFIFISVGIFQFNVTLVWSATLNLMLPD